MKFPKNLISAIIAMIVMNMCFAQGFEGTIKLTSDSPYGLNADYTIKGQKTKMQRQSKKGQVTMIFDEETDDMIVLTTNNSKKIAVKNNLNDNPYLKRYKEQTAKSAIKTDYKVTEEKAMINGYNCTKITWSNEESEGFAWVTKDLDLNFEQLLPVQQNPKHVRNPWKTAFAKEGMIMQMFIKEVVTQKEWTMDAKVNKTSIEEEEFAVPADYQIMDISDMRQLMKDAQNDPQKMQQIKEMMRN